MNICVYGAASNAIDKALTESNFELGKLMAKRGHTLIFGAGGGGMMGAVARGTKSGDGEIIGIVPHFFNVDGVLFDGCDRLVRTETMRERKQILEQLSDGFAITAGGIGTMDEFFEILTLRTLGRHAKPIAVVNTDGCYDALYSLLSQMVENGFMKQAALDMVKFVKTNEELLDYLENYNGEICDISEMKDIK